jgi:hypothetical protein
MPRRLNWCLCEALRAGLIQPVCRPLRGRVARDRRCGPWRGRSRVLPIEARASKPALRRGVFDLRVRESGSRNQPLSGISLDPAPQRRRGVGQRGVRRTARTRGQQELNRFHDASIAAPEGRICRLTEARSGRFPATLKWSQPGSNRRPPACKEPATAFGCGSDADFARKRGIHAKAVDPCGWDRGG